MTQTDQTVLELFDESYEMDKYRLLDRDRNVCKRLQSMVEASVDTATADGARASADWERCAKNAAGYDPSSLNGRRRTESSSKGGGGKGKKDGRSISFSLTAKKGEEAASIMREMGMVRSPSTTVPSHSSELLVAHNPDPPCLLLRDVSGVTNMFYMVTTSRPDELLPTPHVNTARDLFQ